MAFSGVDILCGSIEFINGASILGKVAWSQNMATPGTTSQEAPATSGLTFEVRASVDVYVAVGPSPNPTGTKRFPVAAGETRNVLALPGDKLAWVAA